MAKAMQTNAWISFDPVTGKNTRYDPDFIEQCRNEMEQQRLNWWRWFEADGRSLLSSSPMRTWWRKKNAVVRNIVELLEAQKDVAEEIDLPDVEKQGDEINAEWASRFAQRSD